MPENQARFFNLLMEVLDHEGELIQGNRLIIASDFISQINELPQISECFNDLLNLLGSTYDFPLHYGPIYDGLLINHPKLGSRVIEFDEEQHFTPHRMMSIQLFREYLPFSNDYVDLFNRNCVRERSLSKNRIHNVIDSISYQNLMETTLGIIDHVSENNINNNFIGRVAGFRYPGGRLAQRAVYDLMKDLYHLIEPNFDLIIRFSIFEFEIKFRRPFELCEDEQIKRHIIENLNL